MRWKTKPEPNHGDIKRVTRFALIPVKIGDNFIWLEKYVLVYEYVNCHEGLFWCKMNREFFNTDL